MEIIPTYVTWEQAKWLKEKGLVSDCKRYWVNYSNSEYKEMSNIQLEDLDREVGIGGNLIIPKYEQWQVVEWLRVNHGIWVYVKQGYLWEWYIETIENNPVLVHRDGLENSPQEAYSAAFDYIKDKELI